MPVFIDHLRAEAGLVEIGLQQLETHRSEMLSARQARFGELRLTLYGLRLVFLRSYLPKVESLLLPALEHTQPMQHEPSASTLDSARTLHQGAHYDLGKLMLEVDTFEREKDIDVLAWRLNEYIRNAYRLIDFEVNMLFPWAEARFNGLDQERLLSHALDIDRKHGFERVRGTQILMNPIRTAVG
jgi:hypothetical protein